MAQPLPPLPPQAVCALCGEAKALQESHVIPSFVVRDLREMSATGHIRAGEAPNRRVQDGTKVRYLCRDCEQRIGVWEKAFSERIYSRAPDDRTSLEFDSWMSLFAASLVWRATRLYQLCGVLPQPSEPYESAEKTWRAYLLGEVPNVGTHELHLLPLEAPTGVPAPGAVRGLDAIPPNWSRYSLTTMAFDLPVQDGSGVALVYVKIPRYAIFGVAKAGPRRKFPLMGGSKLPMRRGRFGPRDYRIGVALMNYMQAEARKAARMIATLSPTQDAKIQEAMKRDPDRVLGSESFRAIRADVALFGSDAFGYDPPPDEE
jgi:hypothetical protein